MLSKLGCGQASERDGSRGGNIGFEDVGGAARAAGAGQRCKCHASLAASAAAVRGRGEEQEEDLLHTDGP